MADIFISYSRKDSEHAITLAERLRAKGIEVWIDQHGIVGAEKWATEIVEGIRRCSTFLLLISEDSVNSENVLKELSLASESGKRILPVDIYSTELPASFMYALAGLQRVNVSDFEGIFRAHKYGVERTIKTDKRKSLMILPFEDHSPEADNQWFANGIVSELISSLSNVKSLRLIDAQTTKEFRNYKGSLTHYAKEMDIRYFVQGDVRKFADQIKISSQLLDIATGEHLWQDSMKGTMENIFDFQELVAKKVVEGLNIILTKDEEKQVLKKPTENAEAYELYLKGSEFYKRFTRTDYDRALLFLEEAVNLDEAFATAHIEIANISLAYFELYSRDHKLIIKTKEHIAKAQSILGQTKEIYWISSHLAYCTGNLHDALHLAKLAVDLDPKFALGYEALGFAYKAIGKLQEAAEAWKKQIHLAPYNRSAQYNYLTLLNERGETTLLVKESLLALPAYERYLRLNPDDMFTRVNYALILSFAAEHELALTEAKKLEAMEELDAFTLYTLACVFLQEGEKASGLSALRKTIDCGFRGIESFRNDPDLNPLRGMPEFETLIKELENKIETEKNV